MEHLEEPLRLMHDLPCPYLLTEVVVVVVVVDEQGSKPQAGRPLPRVKGHVAKDGALGTKSHSYIWSSIRIGLVCGVPLIT
jgi:hypothetical protein